MTIISQTAFGQVKDYSTTDRKDIPVEYTWKIEDLYATKSDWDADKDATVNLISQVDAKIKTWTSSSKDMLEMLELLNTINLKSARLYGYTSHQAAVDMSNTDYQKMDGELQSIFVNFGAKLAFFNPDVLALGKEKFDSYLKEEPKLAPYKFGVEDVLRSKDHVLPEEKQKIVSLTGLFTGVPSKTSTMLNDVELPPVEVTINGEKVPLNYANYSKYRSDKDPKIRSMVMREFWKHGKKFENSLALLQDGAVKTHLFGAKVRNFDNCLEARLFDDNIPVDVYNQLVTSVKENLTPLHRYLKLKQRLLKLDKYRYEDIYASAVPSVDKTFSLEDSKKFITESLKPLGKEYQDALETAFTNRWMDIYPNKGKESGAYSGGVYGVHPYIKLNYNGKYDAVSTMAHELGHAMHSYLSDKYQPYSTSGYATFIAEIASTFNENMLMLYLLKNETDDMFKLYILDSYLDQVRGTLYRQTLFSDFELAMHKKVEEGNSLTSDWLDKKYLDLTREYYGHDKGVCEVDDYIQVEWSKIPHFYYNFYVFQYSTAIISSMALAELVSNGTEKERDAYLTMLKSGGSDYPVEILKRAGVDMTTKEPYLKAFKRFGDLVTEMEKIMERLNIK
ncbi:MAG: oligoendopeptidase F [Ignavibacteria bacterium]|nr:oligoendopeptidase F [Ignavibacteria bacterium]